jgi:ABC-type nickel/cobalt efflux system permease component RcnA
MDSQKENIQFLLAMQKRIWMLKYASLLLLILFAVNIFLHYMDNRRNEQEKKQLINEMNNLKAKLYDLEQKADKDQQAGT